MNPVFFLSVFLDHMEVLEAARTETAASSIDRGRILLTTERGRKKERREGERERERERDGERNFLFLFSFLSRSSFLSHSLFLTLSFFLSFSSFLFSSLNLSFTYFLFFIHSHFYLFAISLRDFPTSGPIFPFYSLRFILRQLHQCKQASAYSIQISFLYFPYNLSH